MAILDQLVPIDAVVLDVMLPDIDGLSIRQEIAAHAGNLPVIVLTDSEDPIPMCTLRAWFASRSRRTTSSRRS